MSDEGKGGILLGVIAASFIWIMATYANDLSRPWKLAQLHCQTLGHSDGWWDGKNNRIRCVDIRIQERP